MTARAILVTAAAILAMNAHANTAADLIDAPFLAALAAVESGGDDAAVNAREDAHGRYQIRAAYLADANEYAGTSYTLQDCHDPAIARAVVTAYLTRYGNALARRTGRPCTRADLARIHNGGPKGAERDATLAYAERFTFADANAVVALAAALEGGVK